MAMVLDAFVSFFVERLGDFVIEEVVMLLGVKDELEGLKGTLEDITAVLRDAERRKIGDGSIRLWLSKLREIMYDADDLIDDCRLEAENHRRQQTSPSSSVRCRFCTDLFSCFSCVGYRHEIGKRIMGINAKLEEISKRRPALQLETTSNSTTSRRVDDVGARSGGSLGLITSRDTSELIDESEIVGIDGDAKSLVDLLTGGSSQKSLVYAIVGMGGIGKTTLAQKVFNDERIKSHFEIKMWVCVSRDFSVEDLLKQIIRSAGGNYGEARTRAELDPLLSRVVANKRFLLVLDDIWNGRIWEDILKRPLRTGAVDGRVLVTTRTEEVVGRTGEVYFHQMKLLPKEEGWSMLCKVFGNDEMEEILKLRDIIGMEIVKKCKGLPLAIKAIRGVLGEKGPSEVEWRKVLSSQSWTLTDLPSGVMPALHLSYEDLPSHLKQCFIYCSLFPEDFKFHQPNLVQMWIAEGFVNARGGLPLEDVADEYYKELVKRSLLQAVPDYYDGLGCKMHSLFRALALYVSQNEYLYRASHGLLDAAAASVRPRHLTIVGEDALEIPEINKKYECLRTLLLSRNPLIKTIPDDFFDKLRRLRVLDLTYTGIESLPDSVGNLIHLRFLNASFTKLKELPDSVQYLKNLQALKVSGCKLLRRLPDGVVQLHNIRHLTAGATDTQLDRMPVGMGELQNLRTLYGFVANDGNGSFEGCNMKELKNLTQLRHLTIHKLERVAGRGEALEAMLRNKVNLNYLRLSCTRRANRQQFVEDEIKKIEEVFEGLFPSSSLEALHIEGFFGREFPSCISTDLCNLKWLRLDDCKLCRRLPPLGQLTRLRVLHVWGVSAATTIGPEFFGGANAFAKLQELYFWGMTKWKQWQGLEQGALPCLEKLYIIKCPKLKSLPEGLHHATALRRLVIEGADGLRTIKNLPSVTELKILNNSKLEVVSNFPELKTMDVGNCPALKDTRNLDALSHLMLSDDKMEVLPLWLAHITSLQRLDLTCNVALLSRCSTDGHDWPVIRSLPRVEARSQDGLKYVSYIKTPLWFQSNLTGDGDEAAVALSPLAS